MLFSAKWERGSDRQARGRGLRSVDALVDLVHLRIARRERRRGHVVRAALGDHLVAGVEERDVDPHAPALAVARGQLVARLVHEAHAQLALVRPALHVDRVALHSCVRAAASATDWFVSPVSKSG